MTFEEKEGKLVASWSEPDNREDCEVKYKISFTINNGEVDSYETADTYYEFEDLVLAPCTEVVAHLIAINPDNVESEQEDGRYKKGKY